MAHVANPCAIPPLRRSASAAAARVDAGKPRGTDVDSPKGDRHAPSILTLSIRDDEVLHAAYMPFLRRGGLFVPTAERYRLGDEVLLIVDLPDGGPSLPVAGTVVWITPEPGTGGRRQDAPTPGIGVEFDARDDSARGRIEARLGPRPNGGATHTM